MLNRRLNIIALILIFVMLISMVALAAEDVFKVELGLFDRLVCMALLPTEGSFATLKIIRETQMKLAPTDVEYAAAGLRDDLATGGVTATLGWDKVLVVEIEFGIIAKSLIVDALEKLNESEKLQQQHFNIYELFVVGEKVEIKEGD